MSEAGADSRGVQVNTDACETPKEEKGPGALRRYGTGHGLPWRSPAFPEEVAFGDGAE